MVNPTVQYFGQIGLGALVGPAGNLLWETVGNGFNFDTYRTNLESMINYLLPLIKEMEDQNKNLVIGDNEIADLKQKLTEGEGLVKELKEVSEWSLLTPLYTHRLVELEKSIERLLEILKVQGIRDVKGISLLARDLKDQLNDCKSDVKETLDLAKDHKYQLDDCKSDVKDTLDLARKHTSLLDDCKSDVKDIWTLTTRNSDKLVECENNAKEITVLVHKSADQITESATDVKENLCLTRKINAAVERMERYDVSILYSWCAIPEPPSFTVGLDGHVEELKMELLKDEASMLVVTALGGCGKTTLARKICKDQKVKEKFDGNIFFVTVAKKSNCLVVQELYQKRGYQVPAFQEEAIAFNWLQEFLNTTGQVPLLLVLDDVSPGSDSLLDKLDELKRPNHNILVTSRVQFPRFGTAYPLGPLEQGDAMTLFRRTASLSDRSSYKLDNLAEQIVKLCKGFPLAITTIGRSVCKKPTAIWQKRVAEMSRGSSILDSENYLLACLKTSLDALDEQIKECFIDLASFPEDQSIPAVALIDMWAELYGLDEDFLSVANIHELTNRNLANLVTRNGKVELDSYYNEHFITQHDMLRDLAIHQAAQDRIGQRKRLIIDICGDNLPNWWTEHNNKPKETRLLSISTDGTSSAKWHNMHLPKAEVLVLNFQTENYVLPNFVEEMSELKVLIVTNYGVLQADLSNFKLLGSLPNLKRIRLERISIPSISKNSMQLKSLQKISLFMCSIGQAFSNSSIQILEAFPNLVELNIDYCDDLVELPAKLCDLIHLKKLSITNCHKLSALPEEIGELDNLEVLRLRSCVNLEGLPGSIKNLTRLAFLDISNCFSMKELPEEIGEMSGLREINIGQCSRLQALPLSVLLLVELRELICDDETKNLWGEPFKSCLTKVHITVVKEDFNLNWLHYL